ncbi:MAG: hypothetical protein MI723_13215 [Caulobacterales bacterium]|nr:hypothetical protein [Caulobacterales bacterium]
MGLWASLAAVSLAASPARAQSLAAVDPALCVREEIRLAEGEAAVTGAEDLAYDPATGVLFVSAFDRRAVASALKRGEAPPQGLLLAVMREADGWRARSVALSAGEGVSDQFRPHGIALSPGGRRLAVINRRYEGRRRDVAVEMFAVEGDTLAHLATLAHPAFCRANDLAFADELTLLATVDHAGCADWAAGLEDVLGLRLSGVLHVSLTEEGGFYAPPRLARGGVGFANGIVWSHADDGAWVAATREKRVRFLPGEVLFPSAGVDGEPRAAGFVATPGHPDNLTLAADGALLAALHPALIRLARHRADESVSAGSRVAVIDGGGAAVVLDDPQGAGFSAATVAVEADGSLILGSATDAGLFVCPSPTP